MFSVEKILLEIAIHNPTMAVDLAKLPDLQPPIPPNAQIGLRRFVAIYRLIPDAIDAFHLSNMSVGIPESRRYAAPLQALVWLAEDGLFEAFGQAVGVEIRFDITADGNEVFHRCPSPAIFIKKDLSALLNSAWGREASLLPDALIYEIISRIVTVAGVEEYALLTKKYDTAKLQKYILQDFKKKRDMFARKDQGLINAALDHSRWERFERVADRLNAPILIHHYITRNIRYRRCAANGPFFTFFHGEGQCTDVAFFAQFLLERSGYQTFVRSVKWSQDPWNGLHTASGLISSDSGYTVVGNFNGINRVCGPFFETAELDHALSGGRNIIDRRWGAYYPPRFF